jgi:hypothetical protein
MRRYISACLTLVICSEAKDFVQMVIDMLAACGHEGNNIESNRYDYC